MSDGIEFRKQIESNFRARQITFETGHTSDIVGLDGAKLRFDFYLKNVQGIPSLPTHCFWQASSGSTCDKVYKYVALDRLDRMREPILCILCGREILKIKTILRFLRAPHLVMDMNQFTEWLMSSEPNEPLLF